MDDERDLVASHRFFSLAEKFHNKDYRDGYVAAHTRGVLARQMRNFREELPQADFAAKIGKQKTVVSRLENPAYSGWSLRTMLEIARKENVAVFVRFVDFPTFLKYSDDMSDAAMRPRSYDQREIDTLAYIDEHRDSSSSRTTINITAFKPETEWTLITLKQRPHKPVVIHTEAGEPAAAKMIASNDSIPSYETIMRDRNPVDSRTA
jgi:hypothetical protein